MDAQATDLAVEEMPQDRDTPDGSRELRAESWPVPCLWMTTREKFERLLDRLSEEQLAAEYQRLRQAVEDERTLDDWGDLDQFSARASRGVLRHMTEDEEKAGLSWEEFRPQ